MKCSEIADRVKRKFGDEAGVQITDTDILRWINDAQKEITNNTDLLQVRKTTDIVFNQGEYATPPDIATVHSIRVNGQQLKALSVVEADEYIRNFDNPSTNITGTPLWYWQWGSSFFLYPIPDTGVVDGIALYCTRYPIECTAMTDTPELNQAYHGRLVEYCEQMAYELDENEQMATAKSQQFNRGLQETAENENWTEHGSYPLINVMPEDM